jgi:hypothetical protein
MKRILALVAFLCAAAAGGTIACAQVVPTPTPIPGGDQTISVPTNTQSNDPQVNSAAQAANINTQINNTNLGLNSYAPGVQCASPQLAVNGFTQGLNGTGSNLNSNGVSVGLITPLGGTNRALCEKIANEILHQRTLDTQITIIQKCAELIKAGITLSAEIYPELNHACSGVQVAMQQLAPPAAATPPPPQVQIESIPPQKAHLSDFAPRMKPKTKVVYVTKYVVCPRVKSKKAPRVCA